ncbi:7TM GPCR protein [Aphelenchoides avenae]|nr:7TM GPCR protein [Aphelenchus avenae]
MSSIPLVHHHLDTTVNTASIGLNILLIYLVVKHSSYGIRAYHRLLLISASIDLALSVCALLAQPAFLPSGGYCAIVSNGYFKNSSYVVNAAILSAHYGFLHASSVWTSMQFWFRHNLICQTGSTSKSITSKVISMLAIMWCALGFAVHGSLFFGPRNEEIAFDALRNNSWPTASESGDPVAPFAYNLEDTRWQVFLYTWTLCSNLGLTIIVVCELRMLKYFRMMAETMSAGTRALHSDIHRAFLAMAICPIITSDLPIFYFCIAVATGAAPGPIAAILESCTSSITLFNPIMTILFVGRYRRTVLSFLLRKRVSSAHCSVVQSAEAKPEIIAPKVVVTQS